MRPAKNTFQKIVSTINNKQVQNRDEFDDEMFDYQDKIQLKSSKQKKTKVKQQYHSDYV